MAGEAKVDTRAVEAALAEAERSLAEMAEAHAAAGSLLVTGISQRTPVRSGRLAASWTVDASGGGVEIGSDEDYAGVIEYGDPERGIEGAHMAADTLEASERELGALYEEALARAMRKAGFEVKE